MAHHFLNPHPGEILKNEYMEPLALSINRFARYLDMPPSRLSRIVNGHTAITADTALRLAKACGTSPELWLGLQADYDLAAMRQKMDKILQHVRPVEEA